MKQKHDILPRNGPSNGRSIRYLPPFPTNTENSSLQAAPGIGREVALSFARQRCPQVAVLDGNEAGLEETGRLCLEINPDVTVLEERYDAKSEEEVGAAVDSVHRRFGRIDYAVNSAGLLHPFPPL